MTQVFDVIFLPLNSAVGAGDAAASPCKIIWQNWLNLVRFWRNLGKIEEKFGEKWLDFGKIKILRPQKHSISYGYASKNNIYAQHSAHSIGWQKRVLMLDVH